MAKVKEKKPPLKERNPYKYYRNAYYACQGGEWACIAAPVIAVFGAKWNEYFVFAEGSDGGVRLTIGCVLALICAAVFMYKKLRHQEKQEKKVTMLSYVIGVGVAFAFIYFFKVILDDLFLIVGCEFAGAVAAYGVDFATQHNLKQMTLYKNALDELKAKDAALKMRDNHYV